MMLPCYEDHGDLETWADISMIHDFHSFSSLFMIPHDFPSFSCSCKGFFFLVRVGGWVK